MSNSYEINRTILRNQNLKLTEAQVAEAFTACPSPDRVGLSRARLELACWLTDCWPMSICVEIAEALLPGPAPSSEDCCIPACLAPLAARDRAPGT